MPTRARDLDNLLKPILDALVSFSLIEDDARVVRIVAGWAADLAKDTVEIRISQAASPETCARIAEGKRAAAASINAVEGE
jgi:Holliday junction resolvase RusA-like endonuclease